MALSPLFSEKERVTEVAVEPQPTKTYQLGNSSIGGFIDDDEALSQAITKAINTARFRFLIYDDQYGSELDSLIGEDVSTALLEEEIPRVIREALIYDDRISDVVDFEIRRTSDQVFVSFRVERTGGGFINEEVVI